MNLYLDDNITDRRLVALLRKVGHSVTLPIEVGQSGQSDAKHLEYALRHGLVLVTHDEVDFSELHDLVLAAGGGHPGIVSIRMDNDRRRDMKPGGIRAAIANLEKAGITIANKIHVLNHWR